MNGFELLVPYFVAEKVARAETERLDRLMQKQATAPNDSDDLDGDNIDFEPEPWVPVILRGYPYDPGFSR
jgi:hypothetical protein